MSGLRRRLGRSDDRGWGRGWLRSDRARERDRKFSEDEQIKALKWQWRVACQRSPVGRMIYTPSGVTIAIPIIKHIDLGPPIRMRVQLSSGQTADDLIKAAPSIASAMNVAALHVATLTPPWVLVTVRLA
jgi:hypothetical protein